MASQPQPGDVLVVRLGGPFAWLIRLGSALLGKPSGWDHVAIVVDGGQVVEGWPTGTRLASLDEYRGVSAISNVTQPMTQAQRDRICTLARSFVGTLYDWAGILGDAEQIIGRNMVKGWVDPNRPNRFVCSSLAAWVYQAAGVDCPRYGRFCFPADWAAFIQAGGFDG